jgi:hypothetical protein
MVHLQACVSRAMSFPKADEFVQHVIAGSMYERIQQMIRQEVPDPADNQVLGT